MDLTAALDYLADKRDTVLVTMKKDGRPQLSNIWSKVSTDGSIRISITADRSKAHNITRDPRVSLYATAPGFGSYVVIDGTADLSPVVTDPHDAAADAMVEYYRSLAGEHPDWDDYRAALVRDRRMLVTITPSHAYGMVT